MSTIGSASNKYVVMSFHMAVEENRGRASAAVLSAAGKDHRKGAAGDSLHR